MVTKKEDTENTVKEKPKNKSQRKSSGNKKPARHFDKTEEGVEEPRSSFGGKKRSRGRGYNQNTERSEAAAANRKRPTASSRANRPASASRAEKTSSSAPRVGKSRAEAPKSSAPARGGRSSAPSKGGNKRR